MSLAIKVQHRPTDPFKYMAEMYEDDTAVYGTITVGDSREEVIGKCADKYEHLTDKQDDEWIPYMSSTSHAAA